MNKVYEIITDRIIEQLKQGTIPWRKPWRASENAPRNLITKTAYRGINVWLLLGAGFDSPYWLTYKQAASVGAQVRKGEKGSVVAFWKRLETDEVDANGKKKYIPLLRYYTVFNARQVDNLPSKLFPPVVVAAPFNPIEACEKIVAGYQKPPTIKQGFSWAKYIPVLDIVEVPKPEAFVTPQGYYGVLFHELIHSTGHSTRLNREIRNTFGSEKYSKEELVAEFGASFLCGEAGIETQTLENSAAYIQNWLSALADDHTLAVKAAGQAQKAADYILNRQPAGETEESGSTPAVNEDKAVAA